MVRVRHILADGREVDSIEGFVIPPTGQTAVVYRIAAEYIRKHPEMIHKKKEIEKNATV